MMDGEEYDSIGLIWCCIRTIKAWESAGQENERRKCLLCQTSIKLNKGVWRIEAGSSSPTCSH